MLQTHRVRTLDQVRSFLDGAEPVEVRPLDRSARYEFVARTLRRFGYWQPGKADKGVARRFAGAGAAAPAHGPGRGGPPAPVNDGVCHMRAPAPVPAHAERLADSGVGRASAASAPFARGASPGDCIEAAGR